MTKLVWAFVAARGCAANSRLHPRTRPRTWSAVLRVQRKLQFPSIPSSLSFFLPTHPSAPPPPLAAPPPALHHGLAQHLQQRPKHHTELPERRQHAAAIRCPSSFANIWSMGRIRSGCPTSQRISGRWRQGERFESSEHRRYVQPITPSARHHPSSSFQQVFQVLYATSRRCRTHFRASLLEPGNSDVHCQFAVAC